MKRLLVIGGSRGIGSAVVRQALARGFAVLAFARSATGMSPSSSAFEWHVGDALDADDIAAALTGIDAAILTLGIRPGPEMLYGPVRLFSAATDGYRVLERPEEWHDGFIARADVADFLLKQVESDLWLRKSPVLRSSMLCNTGARGKGTVPASSG